MSDPQRLLRVIALRLAALGMIILLASVWLSLTIHARTSNAATLQSFDVASAKPRAVEETTALAIQRDYTHAWQSLLLALDQNRADLLDENFTGGARQQWQNAIDAQRQNGLSRRIVDLAARIEPDIILIPGDFFDGARVDPARLAAPFSALSPPLGMYFVTGNHDEYGDLPHYLEALRAAGIRILKNERAIVDGLPILGVSYHESTHILHLRATLESLRPDAGQPCILLSHVPNRLPIAEQAGIALQLSGHTHGGQLFPFTWLTRRAFGKFTHGLHSFGTLKVYTSFGAGTWGPPMRVGTRPEVVVLQFE